MRKWERKWKRFHIPFGWLSVSKEWNDRKLNFFYKVKSTKWTNQSFHDWSQLLLCILSYCGLQIESELHWRYQDANFSRRFSQKCSNFFLISDHTLRECSRPLPIGLFLFISANSHPLLTCTYILEAAIKEFWKFEATFFSNFSCMFLNPKIFFQFEF